MKLYVYDMRWAGAYVIPANSSEEADRFLRQHLQDWCDNNPNAYAREIKQNWIAEVFSTQQEYDIIPGMVIETEGEG